MAEVVGVRFRSTGKMYYFAPGKIKELEKGTGVIVETARGMEFGTISMPPTEVRDSEVIRPLKRVVRIATEEDIRKKEENEGKKQEALRLCQEKIDKHGLEMKLIDVDYTFDSNKIVFYFTADGRVDFRELVKDLAGVFRMRIELRQIGIRDEAKMIGGCGPCGKSLCCASWMSDFQPVSIKMAKNQNLSLNPTKISGICGRLMCCLKYENEVYLELRKGMPDNGERIETPDGPAKVVDTNLIQGKVRARLYTGEKDEDGSEKLSDDINTYGKEEIRRTDRRKKTAQKGTGKAHGKPDRAQAGGNGRRDEDSEIFDGMDEELKEELEALLRD
ncbi:MAG: stage 0 sporulation family protein [Clostridia bacterium]|nr:stage 0 sporulation family protein [Clostridia bacterium]